MCTAAISSSPTCAARSPGSSWKKLGLYYSNKPCLHSGQTILKQYLVQDLLTKFEWQSVCWQCTCSLFIKTNGQTPRVKLTPINVFLPALLFFILQDRGFPSSILSKSSLCHVLLNIVWLNTVHHAVLNYPVKEFGSYCLSISYALFKKPSEWTPAQVAMGTAGNTSVFLDILPPYKLAVVS